jgi:F-type H+-transporting ATPase subunit epsilon
VADALHCTVVSPEQTLYEGGADHVIAPGWNGEVGVYHNHAPMLARLGVGLVRIHGKNRARGAFAVRGGFLEISANDLKLLVTRAVRVEDTDEDAIPGQLEAVKERLQNPPTREEFEELLMEREWLQAQQKLIEFMRATPLESMRATSAEAVKEVSGHFTYTDTDVEAPE